MKGLVAIALLALSCAQQTDGQVISGPDAGFEIFVLTPMDGMPVVVRGASRTVGVAIGGVTPGLEEATIGFGPLPLGITGTQSTWHAGDTSVTLTLTAASDAPEAELPIEIRANANGKVQGTAGVELEVSDVIGALDPTFGDGGRLLLPDAQVAPYAIGRKSDGSFVIAGTGRDSRVFVQHVSADGTLGAFGKYTELASTTAAAIASDGRVAIGITESLGNALIEFDDAGNATIAIAALHPFTAIAWDGDALFLAADQDLRYMSTNGDFSTTSPLVIASLETLAPGRVLAGGLGPAKSATLATFAASTDHIDLVSTSTIDNATQVTNTITDSTSVSLAGIIGPAMHGVARVDSSGQVLATYASGAGWSNSFAAALPNGEPLLAGTSAPFGTATKMISTLGIVERWDPTFGALGHAAVNAGGPTTIVSTALDATGDHLYVVGSVITNSGHLGYLARIRLK